jgi:hypothetical protein
MDLSSKSILDEMGHGCKATGKMKEKGYAGLFSALKGRAAKPE